MAPKATPKGPKHKVRRVLGRSPAAVHDDLDEFGSEKCGVKHFTTCSEHIREISGREDS